MYPRIKHREEGMRDGLQIEDRDIPVADKIRLLDALSETGLTEINVGSFVSPRWTPQMACIDELVTGFKPRDGVTYTYLALNERGHERARAYMPPLSPPQSLPSTHVDMCDVFSQRNFNRTCAQQVDRWPRTVEAAAGRGATEACIAAGSPWGSNWAGEFSLEELLRVLDQQHRLWADAGVAVTRVSLRDAMSWNLPHRVAQTLGAIRRRWPAITSFHLHLHNARGMALTSAYAALTALGPEHTLELDSSIGGMGGCPYCGNGRAAMMIATEDLFHMLEDMGIHTGVDVLKLVEAAWVAEEVVGHPLWGFVSKAGPRPRDDRRYPLDMPFVETFAQARHFLEGPEVYRDSFSPWKEPIRSAQRRG